MTDLSDRLATLSPAKRALLERLRAAPGHPTIPRIADGPAPLSAEQRRIWHLVQLAPGYPVYTIPLGYRLRGPIDVNALRGALRDLVARHETLRTAFRESAGVPVQSVTDGEAFALEVVDLREHEWADAEASYQTDAFARRTFALSRGDTFHALLLHEGDAEWRLLLGLHHLAADGWSVGVMLHDLARLYAARLEGSAPGLDPVSVRFRDFAAWQQRPGATNPADEAYWRRQMDGVPRVLELPADRPRPATQTWAGAKHPFGLSPALAGALRALARRQGTTLYAVITAATGLLLSRYGGEDEIVLGTVQANRARPEVERLIGFFANTLPLRLRVDDHATVADLIAGAHRAAVEMQAHAALPFDRIVELAGVRRDLARPPLVQAVLTLADAPASSLAIPGVSVESLRLDSRTAILELSILLEDTGAGVDGAIQYATDLFLPATIERMAGHLVTLLERFAEDPHRPARELSLAGAEEAAAITAWNGAPSSPPAAETVHALFERQARATPDAAAIVHEGHTVTYKALNERANRVAHALRARGVRPEWCVGVCMPRTPEVVAALLGVLKSGAAYLAIDPAHPPARVREVAARAGARLVIAAEETRGALAGLPPAVPVVAAGELVGGSSADPGPLAAPENLAYVIFTSGSTGGPKGVMIEHRAAATLLRWMRGVLDDEERRGVLASTPLTFDVSVAELFGTLAWGGTLVMVENALAPLPADPPVLAAAMTPTAAAELVREGRFPSRARTVLLGGEAVPATLARDLHALPSVRRVLNLYGPTEDTTYSTCHELEPGAERIAVGRPMSGGRIYVLDAALRHAGIAAPGEVFTAGHGVARGYASRPALTAERFVPDPYGPPGARMYRTLDRGRFRDDGSLDYLGRLDTQVKVRGHRIELGEVEEALAAHPAVARAAAAVREGDGARRLVAYTVAAPGSPAPDAGELRAFLRERIPEYMVPTAFVAMDALPLTASGKLDRRSLPDPGAPALQNRHVAPRSELEREIAAVWSEVLGVASVGVHDDFFDLGGESVLATRLVARLRDRLGVELRVAELLQAPTVDEVARAVTGRRREVRLPLVALQRFGDRRPLFLSHPAGGHVVCYRALSMLLAPLQPVYALQPLGVETGESPLRSIGEMAEHYVRAIRRSWPRGPYRIGGWSFGGVVAWEMAARIEAAGEEVELLAVFDTAPLKAGTVTIDPREHEAVIWHTVAGMAGVGAASRVAVSELRGLEPREQALLMIRRMDAPELFPESRADEVLALTALRAANLQAQAEYAPPRIGARLTYFQTTGSVEIAGNEGGVEYWSGRTAGGCTVIPVPGSHGTILQEPYVRTVAEGVLAAG